MSLPWSSKPETKVVLQTEAAECGLAALTMVASHHGHRVNLSGLRQRYPTSIKGATMANLMVIAADLGLAPRAVRLELDELSQLKMPAILHWDLNHFVVLESVAPGKGVTILDPAVGRRGISIDKASRHFTGIALELTPTASFTPIEARATTRLTDLWSRMSNFRRAFGQVLLLSIVLQFTALLTPFYIQVVIDDAIAQGDANLLFLLMLGFGIVYGLNSVTKALREWVMLTLGQSLAFDLGGNVVRHLIRLPLAYFERRHVGDLMSRVGSIQPIQSLLTRGLVNVLIDSVLFLTTLVVMVVINPLLAGIVLGSTLAYLGYNQLVYPAMRLRAEEEIIARANEETYLMETIRAVRSVKIFGHEAQRENGWRNQYADVISASYRSSLLDIRVGLAENLLFSAAFLICVYFGALRVIESTMTIGTLLAFLSYRSNFVSSATSLVDQVQRWRLLGVHLERLSDIVTERKEEFAPQINRGPLSAPAISLDHLTFAYDEGEAPVIDRVSVDIPRGAFVAIVGSSGAGKTTLFRLILGLLNPQLGRIIIDGVPLGNATMAGWRGRIGAVLQDDCLLTGTIADNIAFFDPTADRDRIIKAAQMAEVDTDIARMPMGYDSLIGDMGAALSSGQRQRIFLARALFRDPDVLFLDEGTANLDPATETRIADMIAALPMTRIVIAHRPALVERADFVFTLDNGHITVREGPLARARAAAVTNRTHSTY